MYISQKFSCKPRKDLQIYCPKELESVFIELTIPNKPNFIVGAVYKHPSMQHYKFNNDFLENLLNEITLKPWLTKGIKQSIKVRDRLYKDIIRTKNIQLCQIKEKSFNKYRNKIVDLVKINRKLHYQKFFEENEKFQSYMARYSRYYIF